MSLAGQIILQVILIGLNAVFAAAEIAVISMNDARLSKLAGEGNTKAVRLVRLTSQPARFLATIQVAITLAGFMGSAFAADNFSDILAGAILSTGISIPKKALDSICVIVITLILSYFTLVFGELVPKRAAMKNAERLALGISSLVSFISTAFAPIVWLLTKSTNGILRLMGIDPDSEDEEVTEEEIRMMVDVGSEKGTIDAAEKEFIQNVFEFDDMSVDEIATHRTDTVVLWLEDNIEEWDVVIRANLHSYFPVCGESIDDVRGVLASEKYFRLQDKKRDNVMRGAVSAAYFVPYNIKADVLFSNMKNSGKDFAIVIDEYGGVQGIITIGDLVWELVGSYDESGVRGGIEHIAKLTWRVSGSADIEEVEKCLQIAIPEGDYDTFGGYVFSMLGVIPPDGVLSTIETEKLHIKNGIISEHRLEAAEVEKIIAE